MISNVTIENTADIAYKDILIKLNYYSTSYGSVGQQRSSTTAVLPITIPPQSKEHLSKGWNAHWVGSTELSNKICPKAS